MFTHSILSIPKQKNSFLSRLYKLTKSYHQSQAFLAVNMPTVRYSKNKHQMEYIS